MEAILSVVIIAAYVVLLIFVAMRARTAREFEDFSIAKRALPLALIFGSITATYVGPGFSIGFVGKGYNSGILFLIVGLAYAVQNILVGLFITPRLRELKDCHTLGDAIGQKYDRKCQILAGLISVGLCTGFSAVMISAGAVVLNNIFGIPPWLSVLLVAIITTPYTTFGGIRASVITDAFHFALFAVLLPVVLLSAFLFHFEGDAANFFKNASEATIEGFKSTTTLEIFSLIGAFLLGETLIPPYANLALASKTIKVSRNGFILAGVFSIVWFAVMVALGIVARDIIPANTAEDHVLLSLVKATMPTAGYALLLVALISIVLSSLDSLLNAGAVVFTQDIIKQFEGLSDRSALVVGRGSTIVIAALAAVTAAFVPSIIKGLLLCYTIWAPAILPVAIFGLWLRNPQPLAGILSMCTGMLVAITLELGPRFAGNQFIYLPTIRVPAIIPALGAAVAAYAAGHLISTLKMRQENRLHNSP